MPFPVSARRLLPAVVLLLALLGALTDAPALGLAALLGSALAGPGRRSGAGR